MPVNQLDILVENTAGSLGQPPNKVKFTAETEQNTANLANKSPQQPSSFERQFNQIRQSKEQNTAEKGKILPTEENSSELDANIIKPKPYEDMAGKGDSTPVVEGIVPDRLPFETTQGSLANFDLSNFKPVSENFVLDETSNNEALNKEFIQVARSESSEFGLTQQPDLIGDITQLKSGVDKFIQTQIETQVQTQAPSQLELSQLNSILVASDSPTNLGDLGQKAEWLKSNKAIELGNYPTTKSLDSLSLRKTNSLSDGFTLNLEKAQIDTKAVVVESKANSIPLSDFKWIEEASSNKLSSKKETQAFASSLLMDAKSKESSVKAMPLKGEVIEELKTKQKSDGLSIKEKNLADSFAGLNTKAEDPTRVKQEFTPPAKGVNPRATQISNAAPLELMSGMVSLPASGFAPGFGLEGELESLGTANLAASVSSVATGGGVQPGVQLAREFTPNMALRIQWMFKQAVNSAEIMLDPPELGPLTVKLHNQNGETNVIFHVNNGQAKELIENNLAKLKELLAEQGIALGDAQVEQQAKKHKQSSFSQINNPGETDSDTNLLDKQPIVTRQGLLDAYI